MRVPKTPSYRLHKASGQAIVTISGKDYYLGPYGSPESRIEYDRLILEWLANGRFIAPAPSIDLTVAEVLDAYWSHANAYYRQPDQDTGESKPTGQLGRVKYALVPVRDLYGATAAREFGPRSLKAVRQWMVNVGWSRKYVNGQTDIVKRCFKWAVSEEMIPGSVYEALRAVAGLRAGRGEARENDPVEPIPDSHIPPVQAVVTPQIRDLIELQLLSGARPGEVLSIRPAEIDRSGPVWLYRPRGHKNLHHGHDRVIYLGPRAQAVLAPYLLRDAESYCFSPREAADQYTRARGWKPIVRTARPIGERYTIGNYGTIIRNACIRAGVPRWHAHQLRHNAATRLCEQFGWEICRLILGHRTLQATRIYAEDSMRKVIEVVAKIG